MPLAASSTAPPLARMRRYTTWSFVPMVAVFGALCVPRVEGLPLAVALAVAVLLSTAQTFHWERGAPPWLACSAVAVGLAVWCVAAALGDDGFAAVPLVVSGALVVTAPPVVGRPWAPAVLLVVVLTPVVVARSASGESLTAPVVVVLFVVAAAWGGFRLNRYQFGLYLEIDAARQTESELAVLRERFRFSSDLHDIQGQALHVSRLQLQLADKVLATDPDRARGHLREAEQLIAETIAETRRLAYGERTVTLAGELANSAALVRAAGIELRVEGEAPVGHRLDALWGHVVREATTNLLRHAQADRVVVELAPDSVVVVNDGAPEQIGEPRGLARLGERFAEAGGTLVARRDGDSFRTEARDGAPDRHPDPIRGTDRDRARDRARRGAGAGAPS
jgi:two-component system sensor histidine kinase DesK